jgi:fucokinase
MGRWMARDPEMTWIQQEIARLALAMRDALTMGDLSQFGTLLGEHWTLNKRMDPGCTNPFIDDLFELMEPYIDGGKLAGAGGGGFAMVIARDEQAVGALTAKLKNVYRGTSVAVWLCAVPEEGVVVGTVPFESKRAAQAAGL